MTNALPSAHYELIRLPTDIDSTPLRLSLAAFRPIPFGSSWVSPVPHVSLKSRYDPMTPEGRLR